jgi:hypothetical protein
MRGLALGGLLTVVVALGPAGAATTQHFMVRSTADLIELCSVGKDDPVRDEAIHFCHGYLVGAYHFQEALHSGPREKPVVCPPDPRPSRDESVRQFVVWARGHDQYMTERAVDTLMRFLTERWPCKE